jgi:hypothetical protein
MTSNCNIGGPAFGLSLVVGAEVGHIAKLALLTELLLTTQHNVPPEGADQQTLQPVCLRCGHGIPSLDTPRCRHASVHVHHIWPEALHYCPVLPQPERAVG